jgi:hypothetical protein
MRYIGIKLGVKNLGTTAYRANPRRTAWVTDLVGRKYRALTEIRSGQGRIELRPGEAQLRSLFFPFRRSAIVRGFGIRPFGSSARPAEYTLTRLATALPPRGIRRVLESPRARIRAVLYGAAKFYPRAIYAPTPPRGMRYVGIKLGLQNLGGRDYLSAPTGSARVFDWTGRPARALRLAGGFAPVKLRKREALVGWIYFRVTTSARLAFFRFEPFGPSGPAAVYPVAGMKTASRLPPGGKPKTLSRRRPSAKIRAVVYGAGTFRAEAIGAPTPREGERYVGIKLGLQNLGASLYLATPARSAMVTDRRGHTFAAVTALQKGLGMVGLPRSRAIVGVVFFRTGKLPLRSFSFKPFGPAVPAASFSLS